MYQHQRRSRSPRRSASKSRSARSKSFRANDAAFDLRDDPVNQAAFWSQESFSLEEIVADNSLPQVVRCTTELLHGEEQGIPAKINVPLLLCPGRTAMKLLAKHVSADQRGRHLMETEDSIVIPSDYQGNFLQLKARTTQDKSESKSLAQIAEGDAPAFLSLSPVVVFYRTEVMSTISQTGNNNMRNVTDESITSSNATKLSRFSRSTTASFVQRKLLQPPGSVYLIVGIGSATVRSKKTKREVKTLKCTDPRGNELYIPIDQGGDFVEVAPPTEGDGQLSVKSSELMNNNRYPSLVRFVYGSSAPRLRPCSYMFTLVDTFREETLVGCLLYPNRALMIELPVISSLRFQLALNTEDLLSLDLPKEAMATMEARRDTFMTDLKLKCKFFHRVHANDGIEGRDELQSATVRTRMHINESYFYF